jgi:hypothetical protein
MPPKVVTGEWKRGLFEHCKVLIGQKLLQGEGDVGSRIVFMKNALFLLHHSFLELGHDIQVVL